MEIAAVQKADINAIVGKVEEVALLIMEAATKEGGMHLAPSARAIGASVKYIRQAKDTYMAIPLSRERSNVSPTSAESPRRWLT